MTDFASFAQGYGLILSSPIADGRWHSCPTERKPRKKQGRYRWDGRFGVVGDFALGFWESYKGETGEVSARDMRKAVLDARQKESRGHAEARRTAQALLGESVMSQHPYLARKGFPKARGFVHPSGDLLIPMRDIKDYTVVNGVQRISVDGTKKFLLGCKAKGSIFRLGHTGPTWLAEGYATSLAIQGALAHLYQQGRVVVAFSSGNLAYVAEFVPRPAFVFADRDISMAGQKAAIATGLPYCMADCGDANDAYLKYGVRRVATLIRELQDKTAGY